ncbi:MAG: hypothetical protein CMH48_00880 [Muricauda sp.]|nr:hypothetical protein [Allomuricauda sp.]MBC29375.1 hypothetical protein [Allomuricauda sp.]|tara:strand:- start:103 stop:2082 length:1980 start_codon:yes stop_codon:yes gene_type:complete
MDFLWTPCFFIDDSSFFVTHIIDTLLTPIKSDFMKHFFCLTVIFLLSIPKNLAQNQQKIDSLLKTLEIAQPDTTKYKTLNNLWYETINNNIDDALTYAEQMIQLGLSSNIDTILSYGYERKAVAYAYLNNFDSSGHYFKKALKMYSINNDKKRMAGIQRNLGQDLNMVGKLDSAYHYYDLAEKNFKAVKDSTGLAGIYNSKAIVYLQKGYYNLALNQAFNSAEISEKFKDSIELVQNQMVIAAIYGEMRDTINAIKYHEKSLSYFENKKQLRQQFAALNLLAGLYMSNEELRSENEKRIASSLSIAEHLKEPSLIYQAQYRQSQLLARKGNYKEAIQMLQYIIDFNDLKYNPQALSQYSVDLGELQMKIREYSKSKENLVLGLEKAIETGNLGMQLKANRLLFELNEMLGNSAAGLSYHKQFKMINDSIFNADNRNRFSELQTIYETEKKEAEIALQEEEINTLNEKAKVDKLTKGLYAGGMASALALFGLSVFGYRQRIKKNRIAREKQEEIYKQEIAHKKKELASQTLHLVQKNTFLEELKENLENLKSSPDKFKMEFRRIVMLLKKEKASDKDWETFKTYFSEVHNDFDQKLKTLYADISEKEIRLAAFLRMNLTTKEIATTMNVLPDSILKSKYRLKKKLGLDRETDLADFLSTI